MTCPCLAEKKTDRYISFDGIDCVGNARRVMEAIARLTTSPHPANLFWEKFLARAHATTGPTPDNLLLIHSNLNQVRELFEEREDEEALALLDQLEAECC